MLAASELRREPGSESGPASPPQEPIKIWSTYGAVSVKIHNVPESAMEMGLLAKARRA